jgi:hypothetical protein
LVAVPVSAIAGDATAEAMTASAAATVAVVMTFTGLSLVPKVTVPAGSAYVFLPLQERVKA